MFHHDLAHTGLSQYDTSTNPGTQKWEFATGYPVDSPVIGVDGTIYVGSSDRNLYAINPDGTRRWKFGTPGYIESSPAIGADGTVFVTTSPPQGGAILSYLYAVKPDGTLRWVFKLGGYFGSSPAIGADGTVYVGSWDGHLYAVNPNGKQKWAFKIVGAFSSPAIGADGSIYICSGDGNLYAVNPDGTQKWAFAVSGGTPAIGADGTIYVGSDDHNLYAVNADGMQKWTFTTGGGVESSPAIGADGTVYVGSDDHNLYAVNPDGTKKWVFATGSIVLSSPAIGVDGTIYVGSDDGNIYAVNADGTQKWASLTGGIVYSSPAIGSDGTIYVGSSDYNLYALNSCPCAPPPPTSVYVPASLPFPYTLIGYTATKNLVIKNLGPALLHISSVASSNPVEFSVSGNTCPAGGLVPRVTCTIAITFTPSSVGARSVTLTLTDNAGSGSQQVVLSGTGAADVTTSASALTWGSYRFGILIKRGFAVINHQNTAVSLAESFSGPNAADFSVASGGTCGSILAAKTACTLLVGFLPGALGSESASLSVTASPDAQSPHAISLSTGDTIPTLVTPALLVFYVTDAHRGSQTKYVTVNNKSPFTLSIGTAITGPFVASGGSCGEAVVGNSSCTIAVTYIPWLGFAGDDMLTVTVSNDPTSPHTVILQGNNPLP
jgi:outer membrane protein assembly factor BamB